MLAALPAAWSQQGTANAIVAKIAGANLPSSVIVATSGGKGVPGQALTIPIAFSLGGTAAPGWLQFDLSFDATQLTFVSVSAGGVLGAGMGLSTNVVSTSDIRIATTGTTPHAIASGVVAYATFMLAPSFGTAGTPMTVLSCRSSDPLGNPLATGCTSGTIGLFTCDLTGDGKVGVADVQTLIAEALGVVAAVDDMNRDGMVNVADIQKVVSAAVGRTCVY